jgi:hypothetical protein
MATENQVKHELNQNNMKQKEYKPTRQEKSKSEMAAIGTMILVTVVALILVINLIFNI